MEKRGQKAAAMFLDALVKSVQSLCHGYLEFQDGIEIMGFINLSVDKENSVDCVLKEKVCKTGENATSFISNSYHAKPAPEDVPSGNGGPCGNKAGSSINSSSKKSNSETRDSDFSGPSQVGSKRKALDDLGGEGCSKKSSSHHSHSSLKTSHLQASGSHRSDSREAECSDSTGGHGQNLEDIDQVKLTGSGIVLERVNEQNCGGEESNDFDVTFIKEEYMEEENAACEFEGSTDQRLASSQFNGRGQNPNAGFGLMSTVSQMDPASSFKAEVTEQDDNQGSTSFQLHPGSSVMRGSDAQARDVEALHSSALPYHIIEREPTLYHSYPKWALSNYSTTHRGRGRRGLSQCSVCSVVFSSSFALSRHQQTVHFKRTPYQCRQCGKRFTRRETLEDHINVKHMMIAKPHQCPSCHLQFSQRTTLRKHIRENVCHFLKMTSKMANSTLNSTV